MSNGVIPIFGFEMRNIIPRKMFLSGRFANKCLQSVCYDLRNRKFILGFSHKDNDQLSTLVRLNRAEFCDDAVEAVKENLYLCHCNDMEYNPENHRIYVARGDKTISVVNPDTLEVESTIQVGVNAWSIARFSNGDFLIHDGIHSRRYDSTFANRLFLSKNDLVTLTDLLHIPYDPIEESYAGYWQGAVTIHDEPYIIYTEWNGITDQIDAGGTLVYNGDSRFKSCVLFNPVKKTILRCPTFMEAEGCCVVENQLVMFFGNEYFGVGICNMDSKQTYYDTFATVHREIPTGESLNNIFTPGFYRSKNAGKTRTILNLPNVEAIKSAGFYMEVQNVGLNHIRQTIYSDNFWDSDIILTRGYSYDYGWGYWYKYCLQKV